MRVTGNSKSAGAARDGDEKGINVLVVYEDFPAGQRALALFDHVAEHPANPAPLNVVMWKYSLLAVPSLRHMATEDAISADMIVVAGHEAHDLPEAFKKWIGLWVLQSLKTRRTLVSLLEGGFNSKGADARTRSFLRNVARIGRMEFIDNAALGNGALHGVQIEGKKASDSDPGKWGSWFRGQLRQEWN